MSQRVVLIGGSGFLGREIRARLVALGDSVDVVGRSRDQVHEGWRAVHWDGQTLGPWIDSLADADVVVHLAGKRVDCRPTDANLRELISSREGTVRVVGAALQEVGHQPATWVQMSSLARYGDVPTGTVDEFSRLPLDGVPQQVEVCRRWEAAYRDVTASVERPVLLRPGIAIGGDDDPALAQMERLVRFGLAGTVAGGDQWVSWIAAIDMFDIIMRAIKNSTMRGEYCVTAPEAVQNRDFMAAYRRAFGRRFGIPSAAPLVRLGAQLLGSDPSLILTGRAGVPTRLLAEGYEFRVTDIDEAIRLAIQA